MAGRGVQPACIVPVSRAFRNSGYDRAGSGQTRQARSSPAGHRSSPGRTIPGTAHARHAKRPWPSAAGRAGDGPAGNRAAPGGRVSRPARHRDCHPARCLGADLPGHEHPARQRRASGPGPERDRPGGAQARGRAGSRPAGGRPLPGLAGRHDARRLRPVRGGPGGGPPGCGDLRHAGQPAGRQRDPGRADRDPAGAADPAVRRAGRAVCAAEGRLADLRPGADRQWPAGVRRSARCSSVFFTWLDVLPPVLARPGPVAAGTPRTWFFPCSRCRADGGAPSGRSARAWWRSRPDYVTLARLNGLGARRVLPRYALRNAMAPSVQSFAHRTCTCWAGSSWRTCSPTRHRHAAPRRHHPGHHGGPVGFDDTGRAVYC